jgi:hypothetical protein
MYCGGKIPQRRNAPPPVTGKAPDTITRGSSRTPAQKQPSGGEESDEEEEEGGISAYLQQGEQVLIGSLNVSVKKFFFHAYLTDRRIFLIDTQEKKLKVTAKDIPLETITENSVEFSENSDPVLVLSIRSADDEIKTMKLVFTGNGMDRSAEVDEWVEILNEQTQPKKHKKPSVQKHTARQPEAREEVPDDEPEEEEKIPEPHNVPKSPVRDEIRPVKRPVKDHEKQQPVKRLLSLYKTEPDAEEQETRPATTSAGPRAQSPAGTLKKNLPQQAPYREIPPSREPADKSVRKVEVQSAMRSAMKSATEPVSKTAEKPSPRPIAAPPVKKRVRPELETSVPPAQVSEDEAVGFEEAGGEDTAGPLFCQNCGKKLPAAANFCPGCGTKISPHKEKHPQQAHEKSARSRHEEVPEEPKSKEKAGEQPRPAKPPAKKAPKGSEMTILHKFLRR